MMNLQVDDQTGAAIYRLAQESGVTVSHLLQKLLPQEPLKENASDEPLKQALNDSRTRYYALFEKTNDAIFIFDLNLVHIEMNQRALDLLGYPADEIIGHSLYDFVVPEAYDDVSDRTRRLLDGEMLPIYERTFLRSDGARIYGEVNVAIIRDDNGDPLYIQSIVRDITNRKQRELALQESEERFRLIFEHSELGIALADDEGNILSANPALCNLLAYSSEELKTLNFREFTEAHSLEEELALLQQLIAREIPFYQLEKQYITKHEELKWVHLTVSAHWDNEGNPINYIGIIKDISERKISESRLRESETRYRSMITAMAEGIVMHDNSGKIVMANHQAEEILGLTYDQMIGRSSIDPLWRTVHEDGTPFEGDTHPAMMTLKTGQRQSNVVMGVYKPDSSLSWISINSELLMTEDKTSHYGVIATFNDITDRKEAEFSLRQSELQFRILAEASPDTIYIVETRTGHIRYMNHSQFLGYSLDEIQAPGFLMERVLPLDQEGLTQYWKKLLSGEYKLPPIITYRMNDSQGNQRWMQNRDRILQWDENGKPLLILVTLTDVTGYKQTEEALRESQERFQRVVDSVDGLIFAADLNHRFIGAWGKMISRFGLEPEYFLNKTTWDIFANENQALLHEKANQRALSGESVSYEWEFNSINRETPMHFQTSVTPLYNTDEQIIGIVGVTRDITPLWEAKQKELDLKLAQERVSILQSFIQDISHEIRTPLSNIGTNVYLLTKAQGTVKNERYLGRIQEHIDSISTLLDNMLLFVRVKNMAGLEKHRPIMINDMLTVFGDVFGARSNEKQQILDIVVENIPLLTEGDIVLLQDALSRVVENAIKFTPQKGKISIKAEHKAGHIHISISDTGIGISTDAQTQLFKPFFREDIARTQRGFGLGLSIARDIITLHNGHIEVNSSSGKGSTFTVILPGMN